MRLKVYALAIAICVSSVATVWAEDAVKSEPKKNPLPKVKLETSLGDIVLELDREKAPISVENFLAYVNEGFYEGLIFHRVIPGFMIQAGGMDAQMDKKRDGMHSAIKLESNNGLKNLRGTIAMARMNAPDTATSQFFINVVNNSMLDYKASQPNPNGYAVFGKVVEGMDVVDKIRNTECIAHPKYPGGKVVPETPVVIKKTTELGKEVPEAKVEAKPEKEKATPAPVPAPEKKAEPKIPEEKKSE